MKKLIVITSYTLLGLLVTTASAAGPEKDNGEEPHPFQVVLELDFTGGSSHTSSEPITVGNSTAVIQYIACNIRHIPPGTTDAAFQLFADIEGGGSALVLDSGMETTNEFGPGPVDRLQYATAFVTACIGKKCDSLGEEVYESLTVIASRNDFGQTVADETMDCVLTGMLHGG
jgi:hypothetical protein